MAIQPKASTTYRVRKMNNNSILSIFISDRVTANKEDNALVTCKGKQILVRIQDNSARYRIPLVQQQDTWKPCRPSKQGTKTLQQANSVYDLPSTEEYNKWMHAACDFPVKSTWIKAIKAENFEEWLLLTTKRVKKYYLETVETPKGHLNNKQQNVGSTKPKPFERTHNRQDER